MLFVLRCTLCMQAYGSVDEEGGRYLLGDHMGNLSLMVLVREGGRWAHAQQDRLWGQLQRALCSQCSLACFYSPARGEGGLLCQGPGCACVPQLLWALVVLAALSL